MQKKKPLQNSHQMWCLVCSDFHPIYFPPDNTVYKYNSVNKQNINWQIPGLNLTIQAIANLKLCTLILNASDWADNGLINLFFYNQYMLSWFAGKIRVRLVALLAITWCMALFLRMHLCTWCRQPEVGIYKRKQKSKKIKKTKNRPRKR